MNTVQRIAKNMVVLLLARIVSMLFGFFYVMYTARYLGPANYGILAFALALNGIFGVITNFGLDPLIVREVARNKSLAEKYLANGIALKLFFGSLTFLIIIVVVELLGYSEITKKVVYIVTVSMIIAGISNLFNDIYKAFERMEFMSICQILQSMLFLVFVIVGIKLSLNVVYFAMIYLIMSLVVLSWHIIITTWKFLKLKIEVDLEFWKDLIKEAWPFALTAILTSIYYWMDSVMISYMKGNEVVGWYNAAYRIILLTLIIPQVYFTSIFPNLSRYYTTSEITFRNLVHNSLKYMIILSVPIAVLVSILTDNIILLIYGKEYLPSSLALKVLIWTIVPAFVNSTFYHTIASMNQQKAISKISSIGACVNLILNLILIPNYSFLGASVATLATEFVTTILMLFFISKIKKSVLIPIKESFMIIIANFLSGLILLVLLNMLEDRENLVLGILKCSISFISVYFFFLVSLKVITNEDLKLVKQILKLS